MTSVRDTLFGDLPLDQWPSSPGLAFPWVAFEAARNHVSAGRIPSALVEWQRVLAAPGLESRHYLQAWHFLRQHGEVPTPATAKTLLGVVIEVGLPDGLDLLAAYPERAARYYHFSGSAVIWERPDDSLDGAINALLAAAAAVLPHIGPWEKERPGSPPNGQVRLNFLTPSGLHFGQAGMDVMASDPMGAPVLHRGAELMQALIAKSRK